MSSVHVVESEVEPNGSLFRCSGERKESRDEKT